MNKQLTIIIPVWNIVKRGVGRLYFELNSLSEQTNNDFNVIVVDGSNTPEQAKRIKWVCDEYKVKYIHCSIDIYNMPYLYNVGIQNTQTPYCFMTGADYIFPSFLIERLIKELDEETLLIVPSRDLPQSFSFNNFAEEVKKWDNFFNSSIQHPRHGNGNQILSTKWLKDVRGYDERIIGCGGMDNDMVFRADSDGLQIKWLPDEWSIIHQFHLQDKLDTPEKRKQQKTNESLVYAEKWMTVIRNTNKWGLNDKAILYI